MYLRESLRGFWMAGEPGQVTQLLGRMKAGDGAAEGELIPLVYDELRALAAYYLRGERNAETLQPTALVHEAYLRLTRLKHVDWQDSSHFFTVAAGVMRRVLIEHARGRLAAKREGHMVAVDLGEVDLASPMRDEHLLALDDALNRLSGMDPRQAKLVELRFFGGLSEDETAIVLGVSSRTVKRDWRLAKAWLFKQITA